MDTVRAVTEAQDSYDFEALKLLVDVAAALRPFDASDLDAAVDMAIVGAWWMLTKIEISNARLRRLYLEGGDLVHLLLPVSKADFQGSLTVRSYCVCRARVELLCP